MPVGAERSRAEWSEIFDGESRAMEEGMMNLLQYAAGKVPGVEVST